MPLNAVDYAILKRMKTPEMGILVPTMPIPPSFLNIHPQDKVVVGVMCGDGMKFEDQLKHQWGIHEAVCGNRHSHAVAVAGGPMSLAPEQKFRDHVDFRHRFAGPYTATQHDLEDIEIGCFAQETNCVELVAHSPCRLAREAELNLFEIVRGTVNAVSVVARYLEGRPVIQAITQRLALPVRVDCYLHAEQLAKFKTRAINPAKFFEHHDELQEYVTYILEHGVADAYGTN